MQMKNLSVETSGGRPIGVTPAILAAVGHNDELEHMVMQGKCHLIERFHILIQGRYGQNIRLAPESCDYFQVCGIVADRPC